MRCTEPQGSPGARRGRERERESKLVGGMRGWVRGLRGEGFTADRSTTPITGNFIKFSTPFTLVPDSLRHGQFAAAAGYRQPSWARVLAISSYVALPLSFHRYGQSSACKRKKIIRKRYWANDERLSKAFTEKKIMVLRKQCYDLSTSLS